MWCRNLKVCDVHYWCCSQVFPVEPFGFLVSPKLLQILHANQHMKSFQWKPRIESRMHTTIRLSVFKSAMHWSRKACIGTQSNAINTGKEYLAKTTVRLSELKFRQQMTCGGRWLLTPERKLILPSMLYKLQRISKHAARVAKRFKYNQ